MIFTIKWQRTFLNCWCSSILCKVELGNDKIGYLAEDISKRNIEEVAWFLLITYRKIQEEQDKLLIKKEPELRDLESSQLISVTKKGGREP